jgi:hypothetical protein
MEKAGKAEQILKKLRATQSREKGGMGKMILSKHQMIILPTQAIVTPVR